MKIDKIIKISTKPELYKKGTDQMWTDTHISNELLEIHLNQDIGLASRKLSTIESTVNWILDNSSKKRLNILDLGCGPGLYAEKFAKKGHQVTGIDFSINSIDYAQLKAKEKKLDINYINGDYLSLDFGENIYDLIILVFTDLGVLLPDDRNILLGKIRKALKPKGVFIFDLLNDKDIEEKVLPKDWNLSNGGFWSKNPYLHLSESFHYKTEKVILYQHTLVHEEDNAKCYRFWTHFFSNSDIKEMLAKNGLYVESIHTDVLPSDDLMNDSNVLFTVSKKV